MKLSVYLLKDFLSKRVHHFLFYTTQHFWLICKLGVNEVPVNLFMTRLSSEILQKGVCLEIISTPPHWKILLKILKVISDFEYSIGVLPLTQDSSWGRIFIIFLQLDIICEQVVSSELYTILWWATLWAAQWLKKFRVYVYSTWERTVNEDHCATNTVQEMG